MANKQYLIELAVKDDKLKSSLKKALENADVQKQLGILGEGVTEHLEKDVSRAASILGKVDWASLLGTKDFEHLQQLVAKTVSANKDLIKSFIKKNDTQGIQDTIELVSELGKELRSIDPSFTVKGLASSMNSFIKTLKPISDALGQMTDGSERFASSLNSLFNNFDTTTINKQIKETYALVASTIDSMNKPAAKNALKAMFEDAYGSAEKLEDALLSDDAMDAYLSKFKTAKDIAGEIRRLMDDAGRGNKDIKGRLVYKQQLEALHGKLKPIMPTIDSSAIKKDVNVVAHELDATIEKITDKLEDSFNKTIEKKLGSIKVKVEVPTEDKLISDINTVIEKVNKKGTSTLKLVGAESAINAAQNQILKNTEEWHNRMKDFLKFDKNTDIKLDLGAKLREFGSNVGEDFKKSIEEYFDNPDNRVSVPVELVLSDKNKAVLDGSNITITGGAVSGGGGGEITTESLAKLLTTPIKVAVDEERSDDKPSGKQIFIDRESAFAQEVVDAFEELFKAIERGGAAANKIQGFFDVKGMDLSKLKELPKSVRPNAILDAYETFLERGEASILDQANALTKGSTGNKATSNFAKILQESVLRFNLNNLDADTDTKRTLAREVIEKNYIPKSKTQESVYKLINTSSSKYAIPEWKDLDKLMADLPNTWGELGKDFLPAIDVLKNLRSTITDPKNESEILRFKEGVNTLLEQLSPLYREMSDFMRGYQIGVFQKGHSPYEKMPDYEVRGGAFSGGKLERNLDNIDYFEIYDDPSGHFAKGNRHDATDNASRRERYEAKREAAKAGYRTRRPDRSRIAVEDIVIPKFEPKSRIDEETKEIEAYQKAAEKRAKAVKETMEKEAAAAKELRKVDPSAPKTPTTKQQIDALPKASEIQEIRDEVAILDKQIEESNEKAQELSKFVEENFVETKSPKIGYKKSEVNNKNKVHVHESRLATLSQLLNEPNRTQWASSANLSKKDMDVASKLLSDRKIAQLINSEAGLGLPIDSHLEEAAQARIDAYQKGLNKVDEFLLKHQQQTLKYVQDDDDWLDFSGLIRIQDLQAKKHTLEEKQRRKNGNLSDDDIKALTEVNETIKSDQDIRAVLAGTFTGSQEDETTIRAKINEFKGRMVEAGKSYVADYIDMWSDKNLRDLMNKENVKSRTVVDAHGDSILQEFYHRIVDGGVSKRGDAYDYLRGESVKYQKSIKKDENALGKIVASTFEQAETLDSKNTDADNRVKEEYRKYAHSLLETIQQNAYDVLFGEINNEEKALKHKQNDELRDKFAKLGREYVAQFGEPMFALTESQLGLLKDQNFTLDGFLDQVKNPDVTKEDGTKTTIVDERDNQENAIIANIQKKAELLKQRRFDLLKTIEDRVEKSEDTSSLEKTLTNVEDELISYSDEVPHVLRSEFEADLLNAKHATEEEWKQFKARAEQRQKEYDTSKYTELKGKQSSLLAEITQTTKDGGNTNALVEQLNAINKELVQYEVNVSRAKDIENAVLPADSSVETIRAYNREMAELIKLQQERARREAVGEDLGDIQGEISNQRKTLNKTVRSQISYDQAVAAAYDPKNQAAKFIEQTDQALYELGKNADEASRKLESANRRLRTIQGDGYKTSGLYKDRIEALKDRDVTEYVRSDTYRAQKDNALKKSDQEFGAYLAEQLGEDVASRIVYELKNNTDGADIDSIITSEDEAVTLEKQRIKELLQQRDQLREEYANAQTDIEKEVVRARMSVLRDKFANEKFTGGMGNTSRLAENAFSEAMAESRKNYTDSDAYKKLIEDAKANREAEIEAKLAADKAEKDAKIQEIWNATKANIKKLRQSTLANSEELRTAVDNQAQLDGMGDSSEYKLAIADKVREDLIQQAIVTGQHEQKLVNKQYYEKASALRSELSPAMYDKLNETVDQFVYDSVMSKIRGLIGDNKGLLTGLSEKRETIIKSNVGGIVQKYRDSLSMSETGMYHGINIRDLIMRELANEVEFYEHKYVEATGKYGLLKNERDRAVSFGELGTTEVDNASIARIRADAEARLTTEKAKQVELTERLTALVAQNADQQTVNAVSSALQATEKEIARLQLLSEGAGSALMMRQAAKDEEAAAKKFNPEKLRLWYIDQIEQQKSLIEHGTDDEKTKATDLLARFEQKLAGIEKIIENSKPESERPKTILDMITNAIRDGLANVTAGGSVNLDASIANIATETTLQEILRLLGGNDAVEYANQLKKQLDNYNPRYEKKDDHNGGASERGRSSSKQSWKQKELDKLNDEGQRIYSELDAQAQVFITSLKNGSKTYAPDFNFVKAIKAQADVVKKQEKGTVQYIEEQAKLTTLFQDYYKKTFGTLKKKKGNPYQSEWVTKDAELSKIAGLKDLLLFAGKRADALASAGYSAKKPQSAVDRAVEIAIQKAKELGTTVDETTIREMVENTIRSVQDGGLGRDVNDTIEHLKGDVIKSLYDAIIEGFKSIASGDAMYSEMSYGANKDGKVTDIQHGTMWNTPSAKADYIFGHTHIKDILFGSADFNSAAQNSGIMDILELITPFNTYRIEGLQNIDPTELRAKFEALARFARTIENLKLSQDTYNTMVANAISDSGLSLTATPTGVGASNNFIERQSFSLLQSASNHGLSLSAFEGVLYTFVNSIEEVGYDFENNPQLTQLVEAIKSVDGTTFGSENAKRQALDGLRPLVEEVFGVKPDAQIDHRLMSVLEGLMLKNPALEDELFNREMAFFDKGKTLFSQGEVMFGLGRDGDVKSDIKQGVKEGVTEAYKAPSADRKLPYNLDPNSLIGKLQNTVGGDTNALAKQATLALVLSELQAISKKIPTIGKTGTKSSAQHLLEEFQKMALGSAMDKKERVSNFDLINGAMSPALSGTAATITQRLLDTLSEQYGVEQGYRSQVHTHADSDQTWFSAKDLDHFKRNLGEFGADSIKQQVLLTKDNITVFDMTMIETAEKAALAIDILKKAGSNIDNEALEKLAELGARYQSKDLGTISAKGLMDMLGVKNYKNDGKAPNSTLTQEEHDRRRNVLEEFAKGKASAINSRYSFKSFDGEELKYQLIDMEGNISKVVIAWDELQNKVRVVSDTSTSSIDATVRKIQQYKTEIANAQQELLLSEGDDASFVATEQTVNDIIHKLDNKGLKPDERSKLLDDLETARQKLADEGEKLHKLISKNEKLRNGTTEVKQAISQGAKVRSLVGDAIDTEDVDGLQLFNVDADAPKYLNDYVQAYNDLIKIQQKYIDNGEINSTKVQDSLKVQTAGVKKLGNEAMAAYKKTQELQEQSDRWKNETYTDKAGKAHALGGSKYVGPNMPDRATMLQYAKDVLGVDLSNAKLKATTGELTGVLRKNNYVVADMSVKYDEATGKLHLFQKSERESLAGMPGFLNGLKAKSKAIVQYMMSMTSIYRVFGELRKGIQYVREIDLALTELKKVTDETEETYDIFLKTAAKTGERLGSTISAVTEATATFAKLGYTMEQSTEMAEAAIVYKNVGDNIASTEDAADSIISTMKGFKLEATESMKIVDRFNEIGNRFAITSQGIGEALRLSASALSEGGNSLDESIGLITAANEVVNDPSSVGKNKLADTKSGYISQNPEVDKT